MEVPELTTLIVGRFGIADALDGPDSRVPRWLEQARELGSDVPVDNGRTA